MAEKLYQNDEIIFRTGDPSDFAYLIQTGQVEILKDFPENTIKLATLNVGDIFGEMGLIDERPRSLTARAVGETRLLTVTHDDFADLLQNDPSAAIKYLKMFFERLRAMNMRVASGKNLSVEKPLHKDFEVTLFPLTPIAENFVSPKGFLIKSNIFRVGRKSERNEDPLDVNDLILHDAPPYNISRNHFSIEKDSKGVYVHDRGSYVGTIVNNKSIGGHHHEAVIQLQEGENEIIAGTHISPFRFRVTLKPILT